MADDKDGVRPGDLVGEAEQQVEDVVGAPQRRWCRRAAHSGEVRVDAPVSVLRAQTRLEASRSLAVVDPRSMQHQDRPTFAVRHVVHRHVAYTLSTQDSTGHESAQNRHASPGSVRVLSCWLP